MKKSRLKKLIIDANGIALFVVLSMCLRVPVFENYYFCLGYVVMTVYCYCIGITSGTLVGTMGVALYCILISGLRGMPGWVLGNLILAIVIGLTFKLVKKLKKPWLENVISIAVIVVSTAVAILLVKSMVEHLLYYQPFWLRVMKNVYAFVADVIVIVISIPICRLLEPKLKVFLESETNA